MTRKHNSSHGKTNRKVKAAVKMGKISKTKNITKTMLEGEPASPIFPVDISILKVDPNYAVTFKQITVAFEVTNNTNQTIADIKVSGTVDNIPMLIWPAKSPGIENGFVTIPPKSSITGEYWTYEAAGNHNIVVQVRVPTGQTITIVTPSGQVIHEKVYGPAISDNAQLTVYDNRIPTVLGCEVTQGIQFFNINGQGSNAAPNNSIPLVALKPTIIRVYIDAPQGGGVGGDLWYDLNIGTNAKQLVPVNKDQQYGSGYIVAKPGKTIDRGRTNDTLNFLLPIARCTGTLSFDISVWLDVFNGYPQYYGHVTSDLKFNDIARMRIHAILIHYTGVDFSDHPVDAQPNEADLVSTLDWMVKTYPISGFDLTGIDILQWNAKLAVTQNFNDLQSKIGQLRSMSGTTDLYIGLLPPAAGCGGICGLGGGGSAIFFAGSGTEASHEIGHAFGRAHTQCAITAPGPDPHYPSYDSYPQGSIGEYGVDTGDLSVFDPNMTFDFMSYCSPVWVSPYTYLALKEQITQQLKSITIPRSSKAPSIWNVESTDVLHLFFRIYRDKRLEVSSAFTIQRNPPESDLGSRSDIMVELMAKEGTVTINSMCRALDIHSHENANFCDYAVALPFLSGTNTVRVVNGDRILATLPIASEPPSIKITNVSRHKQQNSIRLSWHGEVSSKTTPRLEYAIRYSHDGGKNWRALATGLTEEKLDVNLSLLPGGDDCRFQVIASAGLRSSVAETDPFAVARKPRTAHIQIPDSKTDIQYGDHASLLGWGFSPDFGMVASDEMIWISESIGRVGTGNRLYLDSLPAGYHRISLHIPNGLGDEAIENVEIKIIERQLNKNP